MAPKPLQNPSSYPFTSRWFATPHGRMHYIDEGSGPVVVCVHGMPTWSFLWRRFVTALSATHRCIAIDHLGFGRSDKPADADYHPRTLSEHLTALLASLDLRDITLVVHDFGGPIGLGHAIRQPHTVSRLVLFNTWMWSLADNPRALTVDRLVKGPIGYILYRWFNGSARWVIPRALAKGHRLEPDVHAAYVGATIRSSERVGQLTLARSLVGASDWYDALWQQRSALEDKPTLLLWGEQDPTFGAEELDRWRAAFPGAELCTFDNVGHFPQEEAPQLAIEELRRFLAPTRPAASAADG